MKFYSLLTLSTVCIGTISHVFAEENLPIAVPEHCHQVTVRTQKSQGVGWILKNEKSLYVLTPAHVTEGFATTTGHCRDQSFALSKVASSPTYDLALFRIKSPPQNILPILTYPNPHPLPEIFSMAPTDKNTFKDSIVVSERIQSAYQIFPIPGQEDQTQKFVGSAVRNASRWNPLIPHPWSILSFAAIRPGMSGSALFHLDFPKVPIGMSVKVEANGDGTLAIPTEQILLLLPQLLQGKDPWTAKDPLAPKLNYAIKNGKRVRILETPADGGKFTELCGDGGGLGDISASHWADGGSHWADGGKNSSSATGELLHGEPSVYQSGLIFTSFYKSKPNCAREGFMDIEGRIFSAIKSPLIKVTETEELFPLLLQVYEKTPTKNRETLSKFAAQNQDFDSFFDSFCTRERMGWKGKRWLSRGSMTFSHLSEGNKTNRLDMNVGSIKVPLIVTKKYEDMIGGSISCDSKKKEIELTYTHLKSEVAGQLSFLISITKEKTIILAHVGPDCQIQSVIPRQNFWTHFGKSTNANILLELDPGKTFATVSFFDLNSQCLKNPSAPPPALVRYIFAGE